MKFTSQPFLLLNFLVELTFIWFAEIAKKFPARQLLEKGADASHRGGDSGFIQIINAKYLIFSDYTGNNLFQTFGNLTVNPYAVCWFIVY